MSDEQQQPAGAVEYRAATLVGVSEPERIIELIVMPYETETVVAHKGKLVREIVTRGAFDGIERRANRVRVNRDHDVTRTVGRAVALHPSREEGLVAEIKIARTHLGDETLALADEGILDASAGFLPMPDGEAWEENRTRRRLNRVWLAHVAMTPDPAYETAQVLSVRSQALTDALRDVPTPNLDRLQAAIRADRYDQLELGR
jgi:HK97 family phage prohead protease